MHKIDRERLREALGNVPSLYDTWGDPLMGDDEDNIDRILKAAENWLEITDPGFEVSIKMLQAAMDEQFEAETRGVNAYPQDVFKAMIAKAGE